MQYYQIMSRRQTFFDQAVSLSPDNPDFRYSRAVNLIYQKRFRMAIADLDFVISHNGGAKAHYNRGYAYEQTGNFTEALNDYKTATQKDPAYATAWDALGHMQQKSGDYKQAIASFDQSIALNQTNANSYMNRGLCKAIENRKDALMDFDKAVSLDPSNAHAWFNRGVYRVNYKVAGDYCKDFKKAAELGLEEARTAVTQICK